MADVVRHTQTIERVTYTVGPESVRRAICSWLYDHHGGFFGPDARLTFDHDGSATLVTDFAQPATPSSAGDL